MRQTVRCGDQRERLVVLVGGRSQREFSMLHELGARIVYLESEVPLRCLPWVDIPVDADFADPAAVLALVRKVCPSTPDAVLTHTEPRLPVAAFLADRLGLPNRGLSLEAARNCHDKLQTKRVLRSAGLPTPRAELALTAEEALEHAAALGFPVVVKPRDGAGGFGVRYCEDGTEVGQAVGELLAGADGAISLPGVLVEEYVPGSEYAVQTLTRDGRTEVLTVFAQHVTPPPVFVETGYDFPAGLPDTRHEELCATVSAAVAAVGIQDWISHTQVRDGPAGFQIIEVNGRRPGGRLSDMTEVLSGVDMVRAATEIALGLPVSRGQPSAGCAAYRSIVVDRPGMLMYNQRPEFGVLRSAVPPIVEVEVPPGDPVLPVQHPRGGVYGRIVVFGDSPEDVEDDLAVVRKALALEVASLAPFDLTYDVREFKPCC